MCLKIFRGIMVLFLIGATVFCFNGSGWAAMGFNKEFKDIPGAKKASASVSGEISVIQPTYISVITKKDKQKGEEFEMIFIIDDSVVFQKKDFMELAEGDVVKVTYDNVTEPDPDKPGEERFVMRMTKEVQFIRAKSTSLGAE